MRIGLQPESGPIVWLAGDPGKDETEFSSASDIEITSAIEVEEDVFVRADEGGFEDKGNLRESISFSSVRKFASHAEAALFSLDYNRTMPRTGRLVLNNPGETGGEENRYLPNVVVLPPRRKVIGVSVLLSYTARGGSFTSTIPS